MTTPWRKTIRDFQQESARTLLVIAAIAIGITGFAAVLSAYAVLTRELDKGYLATNPASAVLHTDAIDDAMVAAVLSDGNVFRRPFTLNGDFSGGVDNLPHGLGIRQLRQRQRVAVAVRSTGQRGRDLIGREWIHVQRHGGPDGGIVGEQIRHWRLAAAIDAVGQSRVDLIRHRLCQRVEAAHIGWKRVVLDLQQTAKRAG